MIGAADKTTDGERRFMLRLGKGNAPPAGLKWGAPATMGPRTLQGFYFVDGARCGDEQLAAWIATALAYVATLPPK
jgi:hypothetical protein